MPRPWSRREFLSRAAGGVAVAAGGVLTSCGGSGRKSGVRAFTYIAPSTLAINFATELLPAAAGYARTDGVDLRVTEARNSPQAVQELLAGRAQVSRLSGVTVAQAVAGAHAPLVAVGTICQDSPFRFISAADRPIRSAQDMKGKTIGVGSRGGAPELTLDVVLASAGIEPSSVARVTVGSDAGAFALVQDGRVAAFIGSSPQIVALRNEGAKFHVFNAASAVPVLGQSYVVTTETAAKRGEDIVAFLRGVRKGIDVLLDDAQVAHTLDLLGKYPLKDLKDRQLFTESMHEESKLWLAAGKGNLLRNVPARWKEGVDLLVHSRLAKGIRPEELYTNKFYARAFG